jgi:hypothetical protein
MDDELSAKELDFLWKSDPLDSSEKVKNSPPLDFTWGGIVEEAPRYVRTIKFAAGVILPLVTTPALSRGYIERGANDLLLCETSSPGDGWPDTLTITGIANSIEEADRWINDESN